MHVVIPSRNENAVVWLEDEVVADVVDDNGLRNVSAQKT